MMMKFILISIFMTSSLFAETTKQVVDQSAKKALENRLKEAVSLATSGLQNAEPKVDCEEQPRQFVVVGVSGFGTGENGKGQPSGAHDNLPNDKRISSTIKLTHSTSKMRLQEIVDSFKCKELPPAKRPGLMIMANSWGSGAAYRLSQMYQAQCQEPVELFVMVDGVSKPIGPFKKTPPARQCVNYYERLSTIHGSEINGCENIDLGSSCRKGGLADCHIDVEWAGTSAGASVMLKKLSN